MALFLLTLLVPFYFYVGSLQLTPYRVVLLAVTGPLVLSWLLGGAGKIRIADIAIFLYCGWAALSFSLVHDIRTGIESGGILFAETIGAYLIGRVFIRDADSFHAACVWMFRIVLLLLPFAIIEAVTARNLVLEIANAIGPSNHTVNKEPRWGLDRAQGPFPHPILFGVFCGVILTLTYFVLGYGRSWVRRVFQAGLVFVTGSLSLSSGPMSAIAAQCLLIGYDGTMQFIRQRWILLLLAVISMTLLIEIVANRSTAEIFIDYFAFSKATAYNRIHIWAYGSASVLNHPFIGIGFNEWERAPWMSTSIDMFWLVPAIRHGIPAALFLQLALFAVVLQLSLKPIASARVSNYRLGYLLCLVGYFIAGWTVHYWSEVYVQFLFILGSGVWMLDADEAREAVGPARSPVSRPRRAAADGAVARPSRAPHGRRAASSQPSTG